MSLTWRSWSFLVIVDVFTYCLPILGRLAANVRFSSQIFPHPRSKSEVIIASISSNQPCMKDPSER